MMREWYAAEPAPMPIAPGSDALAWRLYVAEPAPVDEWSERDAGV